MGRVGGLVRRRWLTMATFVLLGMSMFGGSALASGVPAWRVTVEGGFPSNVPQGGSGTFLVGVENIGDAASAAGSPITVVDRLPAGIVATQAAGSFWGCTISPDKHTVTCTYQAGVTIPPVSRTPGGRDNTGIGSNGLAEAISIAVSVEPSAVGSLLDTASVSGGGASAQASGSASIDVSSSPAPFGIASFDQWSTNLDGTPATQAGFRPYETTTSFTIDTYQHSGAGLAGVGPGGVLRNVSVELPAGFVGNPSVVPRCPRQAFDDRQKNPNNALADCPSDTQVGVAFVNVELGGPVVQLPVYNLVPPAGVAAQFGVAAAKYVGLLDAGVRPVPGGTYNLVVESHDLQTEGFISVRVFLWGVPADSAHNVLRVLPGTSTPSFGNNVSSDVAPRPFLRLPTSCGVPQTLAVGGVSWADPLTVASPPSAFSSDEQGNPITIGGCSKLDFVPSLELSPESSATSIPTGLTANLHLPQNEDPNGLSEADLKSATVTLPPGLTVSPSAANGLEACSREQIGVTGEGSTLQFSEGAPTCPAASKVGTLEVCTPLLENGPNKEGVKHEGQQACEEEPGIAPLKGEIYLAQQETVENSLIGAYLVIEGDGIVVKLRGKVELGGQAGVKGLQPGQVRASFPTSPQVPFNELRLHFFGGPHASLVTPQTCGSSSATTLITGWNGSVVTPSSNPVTTNSGCIQGFSPSLTAGTTSNTAGTYSPFTLGLSRSDSEQQLSGLSFTLPPGVSAKIAGVPRCGEAQANAGACPEASQIGTVTVGAGPGTEPLYVDGTMYLTGPYKGAPFGEVVEVPAIAGPFNLDENGKPVTVRGAIRVNSSTAQAEVVSDPLPTELRGIQIDERSVQVNVNRSEFLFNPTNCSQLATTGAIRSTRGAVANLLSPFKATGCSKLQFKPGLVVSTAGKASKAQGASLDVKVTYPNGPEGTYANIKSVKVDLPKQLPARLTTLQKACLAATFEANPAGCPSASVVGTVTATTPILEHPLSGPAFLVSHGNEAFPDLEIVLQGERVTVILVGNTNIKKGVTSSTFKAIPDAPVSSFELKLPSGPYSVLAANGSGKSKYDLCGQTFAMPTAITGQNGAVIKPSTKITATGCPKPKKAKKTTVKRKKPTKSTKRGKLK
jgi:hypothetical protein